MLNINIHGFCYSKKKAAESTSVYIYIYMYIPSRKSCDQTLPIFFFASVRGESLGTRLQSVSRHTRGNAIL